MTAVLGADERAHLDQEGWLHLPAVLDAPALATVRATWERCLHAAPAPARGANAGPAGLGDAPELSDLWRAPRVLAAVDHLLAGDVTLVSADGRDPPAGHGQQGLHVDWPEPVAGGQHQLVNAFWLLDDMDAANGATRIVPRSHGSGKAPRGPIAQPHARHVAERVLSGRAGDVLVVSAHLWHSGTRNQSGRRRRLLNVHYATAAVAARLRRATPANV